MKLGIEAKSIINGPAAKDNNIPLLYGNASDEEALLQKISNHLTDCKASGDHERCKVSPSLGCVIDAEELVPLPHRVLNIEGVTPMLEDTRISKKARGSYGTEAQVHHRICSSKMPVYRIELTWWL